MGSLAMAELGDTLVVLRSSPRVYGTPATVVSAKRFEVVEVQKKAKG
jgi:hypothetical protein